MIGGLSTPMGLGIILSWRDQATRGMKQAEGSLRGLQRQAKQTTEQVAKQAEQLGLQYQRHARNAKIGLGAMGLGAILAAPLALAAKEAIDLEDQVGKLKGLLTAKGFTGDEKEMWAAQFGEMIKDVGGNTRVAFDDIMRSSYGIVSGLENMAAVGPALQRSADLAVAANGDIAATSNAIINTMNTFGKKWGDTMTEVEKTDKIFAVMTNVVGRYKTDVNDLSAAMAYATPNASMLGQSLEGTAAGVATLQTKGIQGARAGTTYAMMLRGLLQLTNKFKDETTDAKAATMDLDAYFDTYAKAAKSGGLEKKGNIFAQLKFTDASGQMLETWEIVRNMENLLGLTKEKAIALKKSVEDGGVATADAFKAAGVPVSVVTQMLEAMGEEPMRGWAIMLGESDQLREAAAAAGDLNAAVEALNDAQNTTAGQWEMMKNRLKTMTASLGETFLPMLERVINKLLEATKWLQDFFTAHPSAAKWVAWGTAAGAALLLVGGAVMTVYSGLMMIKTAAAIQALAAASGAAIPSMMGLGIATKIATAATWLWNTALWANPITWIIAGVIALGVGIYLLLKYWDDVTDAMMGAWKWMVKMFNKAPNWLLALVFPLGLIIRYWDQVSTGIGVAWGWMKTLWNSMPGWLQDIIFPLGVIIRNWELLKLAGAGAWEYISTAATNFWEGLKDIVSRTLSWITESAMFQAFMQMLDMWKSAGSWIADQLGLGNLANWLTTTGDNLNRTMVGHYDIPIGPGMPAMAGAGAGGSQSTVDSHDTHTYQITQQPGENEYQLAKRLEKERERKKRRDTNANPGGHMGWS